MATPWGLDDQGTKPFHRPMVPGFPCAFDELVPRSPAHHAAWANLAAAGPGSQGRNGTDSCQGPGRPMSRRFQADRGTLAGQPPWQQGSRGTSRTLAAGVAGYPGDRGTLDRRMPAVAWDQGTCGTQVAMCLVELGRGGPRETWSRYLDGAMLPGPAGTEVPRQLVEPGDWGYGLRGPWVARDMEIRWSKVPGKPIDLGIEPLLDPWWPGTWLHRQAGAWRTRDLGTEGPRDPGSNRPCQPRSLVPGWLGIEVRGDRGTSVAREPFNEGPRSSR